MRTDSYRAQSSIVVSTTNAVEQTVSEDVDRLILASRATSTLRAYGSDWRQFVTWCDALQRIPMPATAPTVAMYVAHLCHTHRPSSIGRKMAAISVAHQAAGYESATQSAMVRAAIQGTKRTLGTAQCRKAAVRVKHIRHLASCLSDSPIDTRDLALIVLSYAGALRRSEVVMLDISDLKFVAEGVLVFLRRSKSDQEGAGATIAIHYGSSTTTCPVRLLKAWLALLPSDDGPLFRAVDKGGTIRSGRLSSQAVARIVQKLAPQMGLEPKVVCGHSMRAGIITDSFSVGAAQAVIARHSRHKSNVIASYLREADCFKQNISGMVGL